MSLIDGNIWAVLEAQQVPFGDLLSRYAALDQTDRLFCALDRDRRRHFLIPLQIGDSELKDETSRGLRVQTTRMAVNGRQVERFLDIECNDRAGHDAFDFIGSHIAQLLSEGESDAVAVVSRVLARWRRFWGQAPRELLSRDEIIGLFGEVWFLSQWLLPDMGATAVSSWRGPFGARHDFERAGSGCSPHAVEIKTTTSTRGRIHIINSIEQLVPPEDGELRLFSLRVREEESAPHSLPTLIAGCIEELSSSPVALSILEAALAEAGYSPAQAGEYEKMHFRIEEEALYAVRDDFPRIIPPSFSAGMPSGIEKVQYVINLNAYDHLCIATTPEDLKSLAT